MTRPTSAAGHASEAALDRPAGGPPTATTLRRLLPVRSAAELLASFTPLLGRLRVRLLQQDGQVHVETSGPTWVAGASEADRVSWLLACAGGAVGHLAIDPAPDEGAESAGVAALRATVARALDDAYGRRMLAAETLERYREAHLLYRVGEALAGTLDPGAVPQRVLREARGVIAADGAGVWLAADTGDGVNGSVPGMEAAVAADGSVPAPAADDLVQLEGEAPGLEAVLGRLADPRVASIAAAGGGRGATAAAVWGDDGTHVLWAPLSVRDTVLGGIWLSRAGSGDVFAAGDLKLLTALAAQAAAFVDNARLHQRALAQQRVTQELQLAYEVQARLMPAEMAARDGWEVAGFWRPAREVSGDFYDLLPHPEGDGLGVVVADVADKGMPAALFMAVVRSLLRAAAVTADPASTVTSVNRLAALDAADGMFVTLWYGLLRPDGGVGYVNAGHNPPLVVRVGGTVERLPRTGILVGWDPAATYAAGSVSLAPGDLLVAFTDGVTEARDAAGTEFGEGRLIDCVRSRRRDGARGVLAAVRAALDGFVGDAAAHDDCTLVVAQRLPPPHGG